MHCAGTDFAPVWRNDRTTWSVVAAVLSAGTRYDSCGCGREPKFRPGTRAELRREEARGTCYHRPASGPAATRGTHPPAAGGPHGPETPVLTRFRGG